MSQVPAESDRRSGRERREGVDRRRRSIPVEVERRSGVDRRSGSERRSFQAQYARFFAAAFAE